MTCPCVGDILSSDFGRLAQLVERLPYKEDVGGSSLSAPTIFYLPMIHSASIPPITFNRALSPKPLRFAASPQRPAEDRPSIQLTDGEMAAFDMLVEGLPNPKLITFPDLQALEDKYKDGWQVFVDEFIQRIQHPDIASPRDLFEHGLWVRSIIRVGKNGEDCLRAYKVYISPFIEDDVLNRVPYLSPTFFMQQMFERNPQNRVEVEDDPEHWLRIERRFMDYYI